MKVRMAVGVCVVMMLAAVVWVRAAETGGGEKKQPTARLFQPWSKISSLSDDQKTRIREIHGKANAEVNAIREKETTDIMALLNDEQKAEAQKLLDEQKKPKTTTEKEGDPSNEKKVQEKKSTE